jgi:hypothetical protein
MTERGERVEEGEEMRWRYLLTHGFLSVSGEFMKILT